LFDWVSNWGKPHVDGLESCPVANQVPKPLVEDFLSQAADYKAQLNGQANGLLKPQSTKDGIDVYSMSINGKVWLDSVPQSQDPLNPKAIQRLEWQTAMDTMQFDSEFHRVVDEYTNGVRTGAQFSVNYSKPGGKTSEVTSFKTTFNEGRMMSQAGKIYNQDFDEVADYTAKFDNSGKLIDYSMTPLGEKAIKECLENGRQISFE